MLQIWLRDAAVVYFGSPKEVINQDKIDVLEKMVRNFEGKRLVEAASSIDESISQLYINVNLGLLFVNLLLNLSGLLNKREETQLV
jgi:hypothetical protein